MKKFNKIVKKKFWWPFENLWQYFQNYSFWHRKKFSFKNFVSTFNFRTNYNLLTNLEPKEYFLSKEEKVSWRFFN